MAIDGADRIADFRAAGEHARPRYPGRPVMLVLAALILSSLACITTNIRLVFDADGSGRGVAQLDFSMPRDLSEKSNKSVSDAVKGLEASGWRNIQTAGGDSRHVRLTAEHLFGIEEGEAAVGDVLQGFTLKIEEADNGYKYYTVEGTADFTSLASSWDQARNDWAVNGIKADEGDFLFDMGEVIVPAEDVRSAIDTYGEPSAKIEVILPGQTPVEASTGWNNAADYLAGTTDMVTFTWKPGVRPKTPLKVVRRLEPLTTVSPEEARSQIATLQAQFATAIPSGSVTWLGRLSGHANNKLIAWLNHANYICSDYQARVLGWLDRVRASPDDATRRLLNGLDYGPIQTNGGGHRAVVLFPRGTDWRTTGVVLDPWPRQKPESFPIAEWPNRLWFVSGAAQPAPDSDAGQLYPQLTGGTSSYPASVVLQGDLSKHLTEPRTILVVRSPVTVSLTFPDGRRIGAEPDGSVVNELPGEVDMVSVPKEGAPGEAEWLFFLPDGPFEVKITGIRDGAFHTLIARTDGFAGYGEQTIAAGQSASFSVDAGGKLSSLARPDGTQVPPKAIAPEDVDGELGISPGVSDSAEAEGGQPAGADSPGLLLLVLVLGGFALLGAGALALVFLGMFGFRGKRG